MNDNKFSISALIKAVFDKNQVQKEADNTAEAVQKEFDKKRPVVKIEADIKDAQAKFNKILDEWKQLKASWNTWTEFKIKSEQLNEAASNLAKFKRELKETKEAAEDSAWDDNKWMWKFMKNLKNTAIWTAAISFVKKLTEKLIELWTNYQKVSDDFDRFIGNSEKTKDLLSELSNFSAKNWLDLQNVRDTANSLLELWTSAEDIIPTMQSLGDISAWTWTSMEDLTGILKDITTEWKLTKDTFNDLIKAWVPIGHQLAEDLGLTVDKVKELASEWKITDEQVSTAFQHMSEEWGAFFNAMSENATTFQGRWNILKTTLVTLWESVATWVMPAFEWLMEDAQNTTDALLETWQTGESWMKKIQQAIYIVVNAFRGLIKIIQSWWSMMWTIFSWAYTVVQWFATDMWNIFVKLFSWDTWEKLWDNIKYWIAQWVNGAIDALNGLVDWINQIPGISFWKVGHVAWWNKTDTWLFDFSSTSNAIEWAAMAMKDTIKDLWEDWSDFFTDVKDGWDNLWQEATKTTKKTNATLNDLIKDITKKSKSWAKDTAKANLEEKKKELLEKRDLMIKEVEESKLSEKDKRQKLLDIYNWYKNELITLEGKTNDQLLKNAEEFLKDYQKEFEKASESDQKAVQESIKKVEDYDKKIWKLAESWNEYKDKAKKSLREVNNSIAELDEDYSENIAERYNKVWDAIKDFERKYWSSNEWLKSLWLDSLRERDSDKISDIKISDAIEYLQLLEEQEILNNNITEEQKKQAENLKDMSETEKLINDYKQKRATLDEQRAIYEAYSSQWSLWEIWKQAIKMEDDVIKYYDKAKDQYVEITDFKNQEIARELLNQQTKLETENQQLEDAKEKELKIINDYNNKILSRWQSDTKAYKTELDNRLAAVKEYVESVKALYDSIPSSARAYWGELNKWVTLVGENWPEAIIRRQASYVQPRNSVMNNSTVYNNQNSLSINWIEIWSFNSVEDLLNWLKPYLTRRN